MAEMIIRLRVNPETGKKDIIIDLHSDDDALPHEHEQMHRKLVEQLISGGLLSESEAGSVIVQRVEEETSTEQALEKAPELPQRKDLSEGA